MRTVAAPPVTDRSHVFAELRALMIRSAPAATLLRDEPGHIELAGPDRDAQSGDLVWFGMTKIGARAVSYHLMPLYSDPSLGTALSAGLEKRRQGKSCFNFTKIDPALFAELSDLTRRCAKEAK